MQNIDEIKEAIFACVDGSKYSEAVCDYALYIAQQLELPIVLLSTIEHPRSSSTTNLSGNLSLGETQELLGELSIEDAAKNKQTRQETKDLLLRLQTKIQASGFRDLYTLQRHGTLHENLQDFQAQIRVVLFGVMGMGHTDAEVEIGSQVEDIIRDVDAPIFLVNKEFSPIKKLMLAFNAKRGSVHALQEVSYSPLFTKDIQRYIVSVDKNTQKAQELTQEAKNLISDPSCYGHVYISRAGDPLACVLESVENNEIDILAVGAYSHTKLKTALFGSFTTKLIKNIKIPLIILK